MENKEEVRKSERILENYKQGSRGTWANGANENRAFVASMQIDQDDADALDAANQPILVVNETTPARNQVVATLTKNSPRWMSYGREKSDVTVASHISSLMEYIWQNSDADTKNALATEDFVDTGMWAMMAYVDYEADYGKGEIMLADIDPLDLYIDPNARRIDTEDAAHKIIYKRCTKEYIENNYPDFDFEGAQQSYADSSENSNKSADVGQVENIENDSEHIKYDVIDRYTKIKVPRFYVKDRELETVFTKEQFEEYKKEPAVIVTSMGNEQYIVDQDAKEWINIYQQKGEIVHYEFDPQNPLPQIEAGFGDPAVTMQITITTKEYFINQGIIQVKTIPVNRIQRVISIGGKFYFGDILPISRYPIVTTMNHFRRHPFPLGDISLIRPLQEQLNKITSKITAYISAITNLTGFVPKGSGIKKQLEENMGKAGMNIFEVDMEVGGTPVFAQYPPMPAGIFEDRQRIIAQIQRIMGAYPFMDGDASQAPETYKATLVIQEEGQNRSQYKRKRIETAINGLAKVVAEMIPQVYTEEKIIRLLKANNLIKEVTFNEESVENGARKIINDLSVGKYDIVMVSGSMLPTNRWARSEYYTGLYEKGILQDASVILRESEIPDVEEVIAKQDKLNQAMQVIQQLQAELKKMSGDMQTLERENLHNKQKVEVEKFKTGLDRITNRAESAVVIGQSAINNEIKATKAKNKPKKTENTQ